MFEQLSGAQERYQAINDRLMDPNVVSDPKQYAELMKEYKNLTPIVEKYCEYKKATEDMEEAKMMLEEGGLDKDFRELIEEQYETSKKDIEVISEQLKILLIPKDPNDDKNVIVEIRGGAGGDEAALFANSLYRMYSMYAESQGWKIEVLNANPRHDSHNDRALAYAQAHGLLMTAGSDVHQVGDAGGASMVCPPFSNGQEFARLLRQGCAAWRSGV